MTATTMTTGPTADGGTRLFGPRGRHRKPRPRKVLLAAGGLALAAGALSLVRLTPDAGLGGYGATEPDPQAAPGTDTDIDLVPGTGAGPGTDRATNASATVGAVPLVSPSSTTAMGGISATPTPGAAPAAPAASATAATAATVVPLPRGAAPTTIPEAPNTPAPAPTATARPHSPATSAAPAPGRTAPPPAPAPAPTAQPTHAPQPAPGLCVPIIGLCVQQRG
ncbi:hypothetical protein RKD27_003584 [Streptomyces sp. SAI-126]|uniref:hypothetical protein n=1 Tax=Streptomyces sp. SAI-126 TaxID=3377732 RepID=UPI003C7CEACC